MTSQARVLRTSYVREALSLQRKQEHTAGSTSSTLLTEVPAAAFQEALASTDVSALFNQVAVFASWLLHFTDYAFCTHKVLMRLHARQRSGKQQGTQLQL